MCLVQAPLRNKSTRNRHRMRLWIHDLELLPGTRQDIEEINWLVECGNPNLTKYDVAINLSIWTVFVIRKLNLMLLSGCGETSSLPISACTLFTLSKKNIVSLIKCSGLAAIKLCSRKKNPPSHQLFPKTIYQDTRPTISMISFHLLFISHPHKLPLPKHFHEQSWRKIEMPVGTPLPWT